MTGLWAVIRREYFQRVRSRWFLVGTLLVPLLFAGMMVVPILYESSREEARKVLAVVDQTGVLFQRVAPRLEEAGFTVRRVEPGAEAALGAEVQAGELGGYLTLGEDALTRGHVVFSGRDGPGLTAGLALRDAVVRSALEVRLGVSSSEDGVNSLLSGGELEVRILEEEGSGAKEGDPVFVGAFAGSMVLYMVILLYAVAVMRATLEEKTGRIVEILVSSVRPWELMLGKILGVGSVGLTQLAVWVSFGILALTLGLPALVASQPEFTDPEFVLDALPGPWLTALFLALFVGGYFLYAAVYAAVGAMCSTEEEAQQAHIPVVMLLVFPIMFLVPVIESPNSPLAVWASLFPFFTPVLMYARAGSGAVPVWQVVLGVTVLFATVPLIAWVAGRIYRVGILMQGKRATLPELWRWIREA
jgi:ABC-2 type transport system permease protein